MNGRATALVADDSRTIRAVVRMELETAGYTVREAGDGVQALAEVRLGGVDVLLLDVEMPELDGFGTIAALKQDPTTADLPVIFLTGRAEGADVIEALRLGAQDYLSKPTQTAELLARVGAAVEVGRLRQQLRERTEELDRASRTDHLTGLINRRYLDERLSTLLSTAVRYDVPCTVLLADVDHFKQVNDLHGHQAGDAVLVEVAERLTSCLRASDMVGRWGGEEFLVLAPHTDLQGGVRLGERLRACMTGTPIELPGGSLRITMSLGGAVALPPHGIVTPESLVRASDENLYAAKQAGRNRSIVSRLAPSG